MEHIVQIQAPLPHIKSVNIWLLRGAPLTLIDTGPRSEEALSALEAGLGREGLRIEDIELRHPDPPPPGPLGARRHDRGPLRSEGRGARSSRRLRRALLRAVRERPLFLTRADAPPWGAGVGDGRQRGILGVHPRHVGALHHRRAPRRRRSRPGRRPRPTRPRAARPQHNRHSAGRRTQQHGIRGRPPSGRYLVEHRGRARGRARWIAAPGADRVSEQPEANRGHAARSVADRPRRSGHRPSPAGAAPPRRTPPAGAIASARVLEDGPANAYEIAGHLWSARTVGEQPLLVVWEVLGHLDLLLDAGAVCEEVLDDGSRYGKARFSLREPNAAPPDPTTSSSIITGPLISYPGGQRAVESN